MRGYMLGVVLVWELASSPALAVDPNYWAAAQGLTGAELRSALHGIIDHHTVIPYDSSSYFDAHDAVDMLDEVPTDTHSVMLIYSPYTALKSTWPAYSREHVWPRSLGSAEGSPAYSDMHHILACDANINSARNNKYFDECVDQCEVHAEAPGALFNDVMFEPPDEDKGDVARALLYLDVRYEGDSGEPDLVLTNGTVTSGCNCMGRLDTLLLWHHQDGVDSRERERHEGVYLLQGNRNPFIDHPEWVCELWPSSSCISPSSGEQLWINEIHYDNSGADQQEGVEVAGQAHLDLKGWKLSFYNGGNGGVYTTLSLGGMLADEQHGWGAAWFSVPGLQNGPTDGVALLAPDGQVQEFLSWEGTLKALSGPALGMNAIPIAPTETTLTPPGYSLQRLGGGEDTRWGGPSAATPGRLNDGQVLWGSQTLDVWLSEIHYDNNGSDVNEGVEVAGVPGTSLTGYSLVFYNFTTSSSYLTTTLSGNIPGSGAIWFAQAGIQNGEKDGVALIDDQGLVVEFISYEGSLTAASGPAAGWTSRDIGVMEATDASPTSSLHRGGDGSWLGPWSGPSPRDPGVP